MIERRKQLAPPVGTRESFREEGKGKRSSDMAGGTLGERVGFSDSESCADTRALEMGT